MAGEAVWTETEPGLWRAEVACLPCQVRRLDDVGRWCPGVELPGVTGVVESDTAWDRRETAQQWAEHLARVWQSLLEGAGQLRVLTMLVEQLLAERGHALGPDPQAVAAIVRQLEAVVREVRRG